MISLPVAVGCTLAALLLALWWVRPRAGQRDALRRYPRSDLAWLFVPLSRGWLRRIRPADRTALGSLRRRALLASFAFLMVAGVCVLGLGRTTPGEPPGGVATREPEAPAAPERRQQAAPRRNVQRNETAPEPPAGSEPVLEDEPLADKRTQTRLYGTAKVSAVYAGHDVRGVRIEGVAPGSFWDLVGVRSGDLIVELNGDVIDTAADTIALLNALERDDVVRLTVRGDDDEERTLYYSAPR